MSARVIPVSPGQILEMDLAKLRSVHPQQINRRLSNNELVHILEQGGAFWMHSDKPEDAHVELTSGLCSNGYINLPEVLKYPNLCLILATHLVHTMKRHGLLERYPDWVIGSDHSAATLSFAVAQILGAKHDFTEKGADGTQFWRRHEILPEELVLQVEDLMTTAKTTRAVREAIHSGNPYPVTFTPMVAVLVNRSATAEVDGTPIISGIQRNIQNWDRKLCPLCKSGSRRLRPRHNWAELTERR